MDEYLAHFRVLENALAECEHLLRCSSAAGLATCPSGPSPRAHRPAPVTCWLEAQGVLAAACGFMRAGQATRMRSCGSSWRGLPRPGRPGRGRNLPAGDPRRRGRPATPRASGTTGRPGLGQHHRHDVCSGGDQGLPGLALYRQRHMGRVRLIIGRLGADPALLEPTPIPILQAAQLLGVPPWRQVRRWPAPRTASAPPAVGRRPRHRLRPPPPPADQPPTCQPRPPPAPAA